MSTHTATASYYVLRSYDDVYPDHVVEIYYKACTLVPPAYLLTNRGEGTWWTQNIRKAQHFDTVAEAEAERDKVIALYQKDGDTPPKMTVHHNQPRPKSTVAKDLENNRPDFTENALKRRGWTPEMIKRYLGEPDECKSGHGSWGQLMNLYKKGRVLEAEQKDEWKNDAARAKKQRKARSKGAKKGWETAALKADNETKLKELEPF